MILRSPHDSNRKRTWRGALNALLGYQSCLDIDAE
jgi:hypothetical protein